MPDPSSLDSLNFVEVLDDFPDMAFIYRADGVLMAMNTVCERRLGVPRGVAIGRFNLFDNEATVGPELMSAYRDAFAGQTRVVAETALRLAEKNSLGVALSDEVQWVETTLVPLARGPDGRAAHVLGMQRDVTELRRSRDQIADARRQIGSQQETIDSLERARQEIESQRATIEALSTPVIEVWDGIITLPLLGQFNTERAEQMTAQLLEAVMRTRARHVILDLTGISVLDTATADHLLRMVSAVSLLGATGVLVGIQAEVAQLIVNLGVDLQRVRVYQNLRQALKACMHAA